MSSKIYMIETMRWELTNNNVMTFEEIRWHMFNVRDFKINTEANKLPVYFPSLVAVEVQQLLTRSGLNIFTAPIAPEVIPLGIEKEDGWGI